MSTRPEEDILYSIIGRRIAQAREVAGPGGLSQSQLADRAGLTRGSVANIERGHQRPPIETLYRLAFALGMTPQALLPTAEEAGLIPSGEMKLPRKEQQAIKKLGLAGGAAELWLRRAKAVVATSEEGEE